MSGLTISYGGTVIHRTTETERTPDGEQHLVPGVRPVTERERLERLATKPLQPRKPQRPCNVGLFDMDARNQEELF